MPGGFLCFSFFTFNRCRQYQPMDQRLDLFASLFLNIRICVCPDLSCWIVLTVVFLSLPQLMLGMWHQWVVYAKDRNQVYHVIVRRFSFRSVIRHGKYLDQIISFSLFLPLIVSASPTTPVHGHRAILWDDKAKKKGPNQIFRHHLTHLYSLILIFCIWIILIIISLCLVLEGSKWIFS